MKADLQAALDALLLAEPSMTFSEAQSELLRGGHVRYENVQDPEVHAELFRYFQRAKDRAGKGRYNSRAPS